MKRLRNIVIGVLLLLIEVYLVSKFFTINHFHKVSGNGNPGILIIILFLITLVWVYYLLYKWLSTINFNNIVFLPMLVLTLIINIGGYYTLRQKYLFIKRSLLENYDSDFVESVLTGFTLYTNSIYVNLISLLMLLSSGITVIIIGLYQRKRIKS